MRQAFGSTAAGESALKTFISYSARDDAVVRCLAAALEAAEPPISPIVVADKREPGKLLADKVTEGIRECDCFVPVLTKSSLRNQWVNQEVGYATAMERLIVPLAETRAVSLLKGFIHDQKDVPFRYSTGLDRLRTGSVDLSAACDSLVDYLQSRRTLAFHSRVEPDSVVSGAPYTTHVELQGHVLNAFFDNRVESFGQPAYDDWNWDPETLPCADNNAPGVLNGLVNVKKSFVHPTAGWPPGVYHIYARVYSHPVPGQNGRALLAEEPHVLVVT